MRPCVLALTRTHTRELCKRTSLFSSHQILLLAYDLLLSFQFETEIGDLAFKLALGGIELVFEYVPSAALLLLCGKHLVSFVCDIPT
jgi:hypothetical protein